MNNGDMPASPIFNEDGVRLEQTLYDGLVIGLTKRETFAMAALQGLISSNDEGAGDRLDELPQYAVDIADALLAALDNKQ